MKRSKKPYTGRDPLFVALKNGATKAAVHKDRRKEASRNKCRDRSGRNSED